MKFNEENGEFYLSNYGNIFALGFKGDAGFIERCYNWAINTCVIGSTAKLGWLYDTGSNFAYICPKNTNAIIVGLVAQFRAEAVIYNEIPPIKDEWDNETESPILELNDDLLNKHAQEKAEKFMSERIILDNFMMRFNQTDAPIYNFLGGTSDN